MPDETLGSSTEQDSSALGDEQAAESSSGENEQGQTGDKGSLDLTKSYKELQATMTRATQENALLRQRVEEMEARIAPVQDSADLPPDIVGADEGVKKEYARFRKLFEWEQERARKYDSARQAQVMEIVQAAKKELPDLDALALAPMVQKLTGNTMPTVEHWKAAYALSKGGTLESIKAAAIEEFKKTSQLKTDAGSLERGGTSGATDNGGKKMTFTEAKEKALREAAAR